MSSPLFDQLLARLTAPPTDHPHFKGPPLDITGLGARELGRLWPHLQRQRNHVENAGGFEAARSILQQAQTLGLAPAIDEASALECFRDLEPGALARAIEILALMDCRPSAAFASEARRVLGTPTDWTANRMQAAVLARLAGGLYAELLASVADHFAESPYVISEFEVLESVGESAMLAFASSPFIACFGPHFHPDAADPAQALAEEPAYVEFSERALRQAAQRLTDIHGGVVPYEADGAFTVDDAAVIARAARVAMLRDEPWLGAILGTLLPRSCVAPTSAKTAPSQSLAIALGHSIQSAPTPEGVLALREALKVVRHASVEKKLSRNLKPAERALAARPEMALRLAVDAKTDKRQATMLATCLEAGFWRELRMSWQEWCQRLVHTPAGASFGSGLIWREISSGASFMVDAARKSKSPALIGFDGNAVGVPDSAMVGLWHPLHADEAGREGWQAYIESRRIRQPIRQAFREHYLPGPGESGSSLSDIFAGHVLSIRPLIGLARREGWLIDKWEGLRRMFGDVRVSFRVGADLYPGAEGDGESRTLGFERRRGRQWQPVTIGELPPALFSEACRAVDLLVSVTAFAIDDDLLAETRPVASSRKRPPVSEEPTPTRMARMRHAVLRRVFAPLASEGRVNLGERHLHVGEHAIHLSTARVTRAGAPVDVEIPAGSPQLQAVPWLPYDEKLLQKIVNTAGVLLAR